jgi:CRP-like cAMP-binding protein
MAAHLLTATPTASLFLKTAPNIHILENKKLQISAILRFLFDKIDFPPRLPILSFSNITLRLLLIILKPMKSTSPNADNTISTKEELSVILKKHLVKLIQISDEEFEFVFSFFQPITVKKKKNLMEKGEICKRHFFVGKGCLRMFFIDNKGVEQTIQFAIENWWITDLISFQKREVSEFFIQAVEDSEVMAIKFDHQEELLRKHPVMERYFRTIYQHAFAASQMRMKFQNDYSKEEMYQHFSRSFPGFIQRIPQYLLASYLGFTPEYLSEIRKKKLS